MQSTLIIFHELTQLLKFQVYFTENDFLVGWFPCASAAHGVKLHASQRKFIFSFLIFSNN